MTYVDLALGAEGLTPSERLVLIYLAAYTDEHGTATPGLVGLAKRTGLGRSTVIRVITTLQAKGVIVVRQRPGKRTNEYSLVSQWFSKSSSNSRTVELRSSVPPSGAAPFETITPVPVKRSKKVRPGQIEDPSDQIEESPVKQVKLKRPEDYGVRDLARKFVTGLKGTPRGGELAYGTADGMMKGLLNKGAAPADVYAAIDAWFEDPATERDMKTSKQSAWQLFSAYYSTYKGRQRRDALVINDESSWEGYI